MWLLDVLRKEAWSRDYQNQAPSVYWLIILQVDDRLSANRAYQSQRSSKSSTS